MSDAFHIRCPKARRQDKAKHLAFELLSPCSPEVFAAVSGLVCPCGTPLSCVPDHAVEPWGRGAGVPDEPTPVNSAAGTAPREGLMPLMAATVEDGVLDPDAAREAVIADTLRALARAVIDGHTSTAQSIAGEVFGRVDPIVLTGMHKHPSGGVAVGFTSNWAAHAMVESFARSLGDAPNYTQMTFESPIPGGYGRFSVTVAREGGESPIDVRKRLQAEVDRLRVAAQAAKSYMAAMEVCQGFCEPSAEACAALASRGDELAKAREAGGP